MTIAITKPGVYSDIDAATYHARDLCPQPALSSGLVRELLTGSPRHAWWKSPDLNPAFQADEDDRFDRGSAAHAVLLEGRTDCLAVYPGVRDWKTKASQEFKAAARADGKIPLLEHQFAQVQGMVAVARPQLAAFEDKPTPLSDGKPEQTIVWREDSVWCRARLDWLHDDRRTVDDYKSTDGSANPTSWSRTLFNIGYDIQAAWYLRGLRAVTGITANWRFVVQEIHAPYALSVIGLSPAALALAERKCLHAIETWRRCLETGVFNGYPTRTCYAELPGWAEAQWLEREYQDDGRPIADQLMGEDTEPKRESTR